MFYGVEIGKLDVEIAGSDEGHPSTAKAITALKGKTVDIARNVEVRTFLEKIVTSKQSGTLKEWLGFELYKQLLVLGFLAGFRAPARSAGKSANHAAAAQYEAFTAAAGALYAAARPDQ